MSRLDERDRQSVLRDLESDDEEIRRLAVERAGALEAATAIPILVERLGDDSWRVRKAAIERLAALPEAERATEALIEALADGDNPGRRNAAVESLVRLGSPALPRLERATTAGDPDVRKLAIDTLGGIGDTRAEATLLARLADPDPNVRAAAAEALGAAGGDGAQGPLLDVATNADEDATVRFSALHALAVREAPLRARDLGAALDDPMLRAAALPLLGCGDDEEAADVLLKGLTSESHPAREGAARALLRMLSDCDGAQGDRLVERIRTVSDATPFVVAAGLHRLEGADLPTRLLWVQLLGLLGREDTVIPILHAGRDEALAEVVLAALEARGALAERVLSRAWSQLDARCRRDACVLFGRTGGRPGCERLLAALEDPELEVRVAAAAAVGARRLEGALPALVRCLSRAAASDDFESEHEVREFGAAIVEVAGADPEGVARAVDLLREQLDAAPDDVRFATADVIGRIGRPEDAELVTRLLADPVARVRRAAVDALIHLDPGPAAESLRLALGDECVDVRVAAVRALGTRCDAAALDDLCRLARDGESSVRAAATRAAGERLAAEPPGAGREALLSLLDGALGDDADVALAALEALAGVGGGEVLRAAAALRRDEPELVYEAVRCVGAHADGAVADELIALVAHPDWTVRAEALHMLADRGVARAVPAILRRLEIEQDEFVRGEMMRALQRLEA